MSEARAYWLHALTPLHVGAGRGVGFIDLPLSREKATNWPVVPGSTVKGVMRGHFQRTGKVSDPGIFRAAFGAGGEDSLAGALVYSDARLVLLPVRSLYGTFAWATSVLALQRLTRDLTAAQIDGIPPLPAPLPADRVFTTHSTELTHPNGRGGRAYLEDLDLTGQEDDVTDQWGNFFARMLFRTDEPWQRLFSARFAVLPDAVFDFLTELGTEVVARIKVSEATGTVDEGALWYEENLPAEAVLAGLTWCDAVPGGNGFTLEGLLDNFCGSAVDCQVGGKATVGRGRARFLFTGREGK
ncbi:MAG: type III-B CRISPR module RAMP protein Cmr4 [Bacillota bacterium]